VETSRTGRNGAVRTVKEISDITGISVRTLHYYDEIGLLKPTSKSEAGYRLYDDKALEQLQQILFFREFDIPLKEIKAVMENPTLDRNYILRMQRRMLMAKIERMEHLVAGIDDILKGDNKMDFAIFNKTEIEEMFEAMIGYMPENLKKMAIDEFGGLEQWRTHYIKAISGEDMQKRYQKMVEWFGGKDAYLNSVKNPVSREVAVSYQRRLDSVLSKISEKQGCAVDSFEVKELIGEYSFVLKQLFRLEDEKGMMLMIAQNYRNEQVKEGTEKRYGAGTAEFFAQAIETFYR